MRYRTILSATLALIVSSAAAARADAATMLAVFTGTITSGFDNTALFGTVATSLAGQAFTASFKYDTTVGTHLGTAGVNDGRQGGTDFGAANPMLSAILTINGVDQNFFGTAEGVTVVDGATNGGLIEDKANTTTRFLNVNLFAGLAPTSLDTPFTGVPGGPAANSSIGTFEIGRFVFQPPQGFVLHDDAKGALKVNHVTITRLDTPSGAPEPAAWALFIGGFGIVGATLRRRRSLRPA